MIQTRNELDSLSYDVLRKAGTEVAFTGKYYETETIGVYECKACGAELFRSEEKFHSGCGWPSFYAPKEGDAVILLEDRSLAPRIRTEVRCAKCGSHLGHVFEGEGYAVQPTQRWVHKFSCASPQAQKLESSTSRGSERASSTRLRGFDEARTSPP